MYTYYIIYMTNNIVWGLPSGVNVDMAAKSPSFSMEVHG